MLDARWPEDSDDITDLKDVLAFKAGAFLLPTPPEIAFKCGSYQHRKTSDPACRLKLLAFPNAEGNPAREVLAIVPERRISRIGERDPHPFQRCRFIRDPGASVASRL